ncbi:MAG: MBL fold metallo-hydrolase [Gemmatimonadetes bacterium]|nr:MBL fold metallo-hydrolase [Gemmatimonadota bacterium]
MIRRAGAIALALALALPPLRGQTGEPFVVRPSATPCLVVRSAPRSDAVPLSCILAGTAVSADSAVPFWRRIRMPDGTIGWSAKKFLGAPSEAGIAPLPAAGGAAGPTTPASIPDSAWLEIHVVDVGQGDGIWISTWDDGVPDNGRFEGRNIVIDGGPDASDQRNEFLKYILPRAHDGAVIDALIVTHPHNDHYPGARGIVAHFDVCDYYDPDTPNGPDFERFMHEVGAATCRGDPVRLRRGFPNFGRPDWGSELGVDFLWSGPITAGAPGMGSGGTRINNASVVLKLTYGTQSFLFTGDAEGKERADDPERPRYAEALMLADSAVASKLKSTLIKVAHHGSETSSTTPFIRAVDPRFVIVSSGRRAYSGTFLPDSATLQRYCAHNSQIRIYRTDQNDAAEGRTTTTDADADHIVIRTNGTVTVVQAYSAGQPYDPVACGP